MDIRDRVAVVGRRAVYGPVRPRDGCLVRHRGALDPARACLRRHPRDGLSECGRRSRRRDPAGRGDDDQDGGRRPADGWREVGDRPARSPARRWATTGGGGSCGSTPRTCRSSAGPTPPVRTSAPARRTWTSCARPPRSPSAGSVATGGPGSGAPATALGVFTAVQAAVAEAGLGDGYGGVAGLRLLVQGLGAVGARVAELAADAGADLLVADLDPGRCAAAGSTGRPGRVLPAEVTRTPVRRAGCPAPPAG